MCCLVVSSEGQEIKVQNVQMQSQTYIMNLCELEFILILIVKDRAIFINEGHDGALPARWPQESNNHIKEPILDNHS